jgi:metal-responsive CopG/Arc/MetJ family transcriptional regulator
LARAQNPAMHNKPELPRVIVPMPRKLLREIDDYRWANRIPSRAEAIRQLIRAGLKTKNQKPEP